jgi:hypothetical protein
MLETFGDGGEDLCRWLVLGGGLGHVFIRMKMLVVSSGLFSILKYGGKV